MAKTKRKHVWFFTGLAATLLAAPNAMIIKVASSKEIDPFLFNVLRFSAIAVMTLPYLLIKLRKIKSSIYKNTLMSGLYMSIAVISFVWAIKLSQASYVSMLTLLTPIVFVVLSARLTGEKITPRAVIGITLGAVGAMIMILLPVALKQNGTFVFYPTATALTLLNVVSFPMAIIHYKKANDGGIPMIPLVGMTAWIIIIVNLLLWLATGSNEGIPNLSNFQESKYLIGSVLYSGVAVALISRALGVLSYEHVGSAETSALSYLETFLAIMLPVVVLHEHLSIEMVAGGILILLGVIVVEFHNSKHHKHLWIQHHR